MLHAFTGPIAHTTQSTIQAALLALMFRAQGQLIRRPTSSCFCLFSSFCRAASSLLTAASLAAIARASSRAALSSSLSCCSAAFFFCSSFASHCAQTVLAFKTLLLIGDKPLSSELLEALLWVPYGNVGIPQLPHQRPKVQAQRAAAL